MECCARCAQYIHVLNEPYCDGNFSHDLRRRCTRCARHGHIYVLVNSAELMLIFNGLVTARLECDRLIAEAGGDASVITPAMVDALGS